MEREKKRAEPERQAGAPLWMVTFCDSMTLMLTFFVLLFSFSSFNVEVFEKLTMSFTKALSSDVPPVEKDKSAFLPMEQIVATGGPGEGSEKATLARGWEGGLKEETEGVDFRSRKVFLISSEEVFWGKGTVISSEGRDTLTKMALFLREVPELIVISENAPGGDKDSEQFGLLRAWAVMEYLTTKRGLDKKLFSISAASTLTQEGLKSSEPEHRGAEAERGLEIVLLERSICN